MSGKVGKRGFVEIEWPNMNHLALGLLHAGDCPMDAATLGILYRLIWHAAAVTVHHYYSDGCGPHRHPEIPIDPEVLCRIANCNALQLARAGGAIDHYFKRVKGGNLRLRDPSIIQIEPQRARPGRAHIPEDTRAVAAARDGMRCVYCGTSDGPFQYDHIWPVSRGGQDVENNLVIACKRCNMAKGNRSLAEWISGGKTILLATRRRDG